jgi:transposase
MIAPEIRSSVQTLRAQGHGLREIARLLGLARNTVRSILRADAADAPEPGNAFRTRHDDAPTPERLSALFERARGNVVRLQQLLAEDGVAVCYTTLTRWTRQAGLRVGRRRAGEYAFEPGAEMQHDTSPHRLEIAGRPVTAQCASLVLAFSRRLFIQYYPRFTRFEAKQFLLAAVAFMDGAGATCVIDNSSVILASGSGADAVIAPEMLAFARTLGFGFLAHRVGHPDRKGRVERPFAYAEGNFLPGRRFDDFADLNRQALSWCREIANAKPKRVLGMTPEAAYVIEKPHLLPLPDVLPPVYEVHDRVVDLYGFVSLDTNRYSAPERFVGQAVTVYKYPAEVRICRRDAPIAAHPRLDGQRNARHVIAEHHPTLAPAKSGPALEETLLRGDHPSLDRYAGELKRRGRGLRALRRLLEMKRTYPRGPFLAAIEQALQFGLFDLGRLERLILKQVADDFFAVPGNGDA